MRRPSTRLIASLLALFILLGAPANVSAWGRVGHRLVVRLALRRLQTTAPGVRAQVASVLNGEPVLEATMWPDDARFQQPYLTTYNNHFVDIPFERPNYLASEDCEFVPGKGDCVIKALDRYSGVLLTPGHSARERRDALAFMLHFIGDMHQPLHATKKDNDNGGNSRKLCVREPGAAESCYEDADHEDKRNLHAAWDNYIITWTDLSENQYFNLLVNRMANMSQAQLAAMEQGTTVRWAEEAHRVAVQNAYQLGSPGRDGFYHITTQYYSNNRANVEQQLMCAGVRLALVLKEIFVEQHAHTSVQPQPAPHSAAASPNAPTKRRSPARRQRARRRSRPPLIKRRAPHGSPRQVFHRAHNLVRPLFS